MASSPVRRRRRRRRRRNSSTTLQHPPNARAGRSSRSWQPQEKELREICAVLEAHVSPNSDQARIWQKLQDYAQLPDFNNYLVFLLARGHGQGEYFEVQQVAGLILKNNLRVAFISMPPSSQQYIKSELLPCIGATNRAIRSTVGTVISVLFQIVRVTGWIELFRALEQCLDSNDLDLMEGAMDAIYKICEDVPEELDVDVPGLSDRPINKLIPRMLQLFQSPHASLRKLSLGCINRYIMVMPSALYMSMDQYLEGLFVLLKDPSADVRKLVCSAWVQFIERRPSILEPHLKNVAEMILQANKDSDDEVALEACKFWSVYSDASMPPEGLREFLPRLIPTLVSNMVFTDDDELLADAEDDADAVNAWNLRRCSAAGLNALSNVFGDDILPTLMPLIQQKLARTDDDESWKEREAAVLSLGVVAEGCITGLCPYLEKIVALLTPLLVDDKFPLLRGTTRWTLSRYSKFIVQEVDRLRAKVANLTESNNQVVDRLYAKVTQFEKSQKDMDESLQWICNNLGETIYEAKNVMAQRDSLQVEVDSLKASLDERTRESEGWKSKCKALKRGLEERTDESEGWNSKCEALKRAFDELSSKVALSGR